MSAEFAQLPKFKDKVINVSAKKSDTKIETSYVISASFKGIVRLSPNNHNTVHERIVTQLSIQDEASLGTTYTDAILFEDKALNSIKTDADITRRMIIASDSDGYLVNLRISEWDVEFDNLGVIGIHKTRGLNIITTKASNNEPILLLNKSCMPALPQVAHPSIQETVDNKEEKDSPNYKTYLSPSPAQFDVRKVNIKGQGDNSYILYGVQGSDNKRIFRYKKSQKFIKDLIMEALLDLETIPTGSIHWLPVTAKQYRDLVQANGGCPNRVFTNDSEELKVDPIVRDFLLCDGRKYYTRDFPELAKVLAYETVPTWRPNTAGTVVAPFQDSYANNYKKQAEKDVGDTKNPRTFRVPDLRHMFISSCKFEGTMSLDHNPSRKTDKTGQFTNDNLPASVQGDTYQGVDTHQHFIAWGTHSHVHGSWESQEFSGFQPVATSRKLEGTHEERRQSSRIKSTGKMTMMYLHNHPAYRDAGFSGDGPHGAQYGANGFSYAKFTPRRSCKWKNLRSNFSIPAIMYLSIPGVYGGSATRYISQSLFDTTSTSGLASNMTCPSSTQISALDPVTSNEVYGAENNVLDGETYADFDQNVYGHESSPKFYAMLPLIKI